MKNNHNLDPTVIMGPPQSILGDMVVISSCPFKLRRALMVSTLVSVGCWRVFKPGRAILSHVHHPPLCEWATITSIHVISCYKKYVISNHDWGISTPRPLQRAWEISSSSQTTQRPGLNCWGNGAIQRTFSGTAGQITHLTRIYRHLPGTFKKLIEKAHHNCYC